MEALTLEKMDKTRYKYLVWQTISFGLFLAGIIIQPLIISPLISNIFLFIEGFGVALFLVVTLKKWYWPEKSRKTPDCTKP